MSARPSPALRHIPARLAAALASAALLGCTGLPPQGGTRPNGSLVLGRNAHYAVVLAAPHTSLESLAARFLGDAGEGWRIAEANGMDAVTPGATVVVPLDAENAIGMYPDGYQTVPVLAYHRFDDSGRKLAVSAAQFEAQLAFLTDHGYTVVPLSGLVAFLRGEAPLPRRSVVLTIDDGYRSTYEVAFPLLRKYGHPATVFVYTDFVGRGGLTWDQLREMQDSGLISIQAHSKTHADLTAGLEGESLADYRARIAREVLEPAEVLETHLGAPRTTYAYPYGNTNRPVVEEVRRAGFVLGVTVRRGANPFFADPFVLRRSMVYAHHDLKDFERMLQVRAGQGVL
jgi:peptidoglycan/xylan/chitin deacetylase (PgdA/CDA1 family)